MAKALKFLLGLVIVVIAAFAALSYFGGTSLGASNPISVVKNSAIDAAIDNSGIKEKIESSLRGNADTIANATGLSETQVNAAIDDLDISDWKSTDLPDDAVVTNTYNGNYGGTEAALTTYEDPSYVTITANDQNVTLAVPESAQSYEQYLQYL
jgi:hypothetical protein